MTVRFVKRREDERVLVGTWRELLTLKRAIQVLEESAGGCAVEACEIDVNDQDVWQYTLRAEEMKGVS
jgi:hypothetical protein